MLFLLAPIILIFNYLVPSFAQVNTKQKPAPLISLEPCEVPGPNPTTKDKARCGKFEVWEIVSTKPVASLLLR